MSSSANPTFDSSRWRHRAANLSPPAGESIRINYVDCKTNAASKGVILLIHGFPQTSYQFRHVISPFSDAGYRVIAPDYRGAGHSSKPKSGYEKMQMAEDLHLLIHDHLGIKEKVHIVGHDIGGMIAWPYVAQYPDDVASLVWGECPLPGTKFYDNIKGTDTVFHFIFHRVPDLPEALIAGRERIYLQYFYNKISINSAFLTPHDLEVYTQAFEQPGAMRAGIELYRAFEKDSQDNQEWIEKHGRVKVPTLGLFASGFVLAEAAENMLSEMHERGTFETALVDDCGHYIAEEQPAKFVEEILRFVQKQAV
jgi:pimeloyl-ACP methyl ester carboxylesterase